MITAMEINPEKIFNRNFFSLLPFDIILLDEHYNIVWANDKFKENFGDPSGHTCYELCKNKNMKCHFNKWHEVFESGETAVTYEFDTDIYGKPQNTAVYFVPINGAGGKVEYIMEISAYQTDSAQWQRQFNLLFDRGSNFITVIDRDFNIIRANDKFCETFGDIRGHKCYKNYKKKKSVCTNCPALLTFEDGEEHVSTQIGITSSGEKSHFIVNTSAIASDENGVSLVMEIGTDITELTMLQEQLKNTHDFYSNIIRHTSDGIVAIDNKGKIQIVNDATRNILGWKETKKPSNSKLHEVLPKEFFSKSFKKNFEIKKKDHLVKDINGNNVPVRFSAIELTDKKKSIGRIAFMQDMRPYLEFETTSRKDAFSATEGLFKIVKKALDMLWTNFINEFMNFESSIYSNNPELIFRQLDILKFKLQRTEILKNAFSSYTKSNLEKSSNVDLVEICSHIFNDYNVEPLKKSFDLIFNAGIDSLPVKANKTAIFSALDILLVSALNNAEKTEEKPVVEISVIKDGDVAVIQISHISAHPLPQKLNKDNCVGFVTSELIIKNHYGALDLLNRNNAFEFKIKLPINY